MKKEKISIEEKAEFLLSEFNEKYEPKNRAIAEIIFNAQNELSDGKIPQVVLKHVVIAIYRLAFIDKVTVGDSANEILKDMDKLSRANGWLLFHFGPM